MSADSRQQFLNTEGLGYVVVGARVQRFYFGVFLLAHRENNDGRARFAPNSAAYVDAGYSWHHEVSNDEIRVPFLENTNRLFRVIGGSDVVTLRGKRSAKHAGDLNFVVDYEDTFRHEPDPAIPRRPLRAAAV